MSKTAEDLRQTIRNAIMNHNNPDATEIILQAIQERAVEFAEWLNGNCESTALGYYHQDHLYSTSDLYKLFTQQNQK